MLDEEEQIIRNRKEAKGLIKTKNIHDDPLKLSGRECKELYIYI